MCRFHSLNACARKCEITSDERYKMCLEWPCVQQIDRFYNEFFLGEIAEKRDILKEKNG